MVNRSRFGRTLGVALSAILILALGAPTASPATASPAAASAQEGATAGLLERSSAPPPAPAPLAQGVSHEPRRGARRTAGAPATRAALSPPAQSVPGALAGAASPLLANFNGVSSRDSALVNFGREVEPPDQGLCVGNGFVVEMVNSAYTVYDTSGKAIAGPFNVGAPFNEGPGEFLSDPRCYYDATTNTWFATILAINKPETESFLDIAVNTSGDPTTPWSAYRLNASDSGGRSGPRHKGCPCLGDQPTLGIDAENLYITTNEFPLAGERFNGAQIYAVAKKDLLKLSPTVHFVHYDKLSIGGELAASVQPAITTAATKAEYFLSAVDTAEVGAQQIGAWALAKPQLVAKGAIPPLSNVLVPSIPYSPPPQAEQKGSTTLIEAGDDRMQQVQYINGSLWGELATTVSIPGDSKPRAGAAWFQLEPTLRRQAISAAPILRQGYLTLAANNLIYPALQVTPAGTAAMVMTLTGAKRFPSVAYSLLAPSASAFGPIQVAAPGSTSYDPTGERWGDYSWAVIDPSGSSVWLASEYVPPRSSQTPDGHGDWGTRVLDVPASGG